jgi:Fe-S-cluster containining protein
MDDLDAGDFSSWLATTQRAIRGEIDADVPCDGCTACCRSSQFVHIAPDEIDTLAHIPPALLFPAPRMAPGHVVLGYDERGHCPMLVDDGCSIYAHRPRTCRTYDCRVFAAAGVELDDPGQVEIDERARRWRFRHPTARDRVQHAAVQAVAAELREHPERLPDSVTPMNATQLAVYAVESVSARG